MLQAKLVISLRTSKGGVRVDNCVNAATRKLRFTEFSFCVIPGLRPAKVHENYPARFFNNLGWVFDPETRKPQIVPKSAIV